MWAIFDQCELLQVDCWVLLTKPICSQWFARYLEQGSSTCNCCLRPLHPFSSAGASVFHGYRGERIRWFHNYLLGTFHLTYVTALEEHPNTVLPTQLLEMTSVVLKLIFCFAVATGLPWEGSHSLWGSSRYPIASLCSPTAPEIPCRYLSCSAVLPAHLYFGVWGNTLSTWLFCKYCLWFLGLLIYSQFLCD